MKKVFLISIIIASLDVTGQTILKDRKQDLRIEKVLQNSVNIYKIFYGANYLILGNVNDKNIFVRELQDVLKNQNNYSTSYILNTFVTYEYVETGVKISVKGSAFILSKKQINKLLLNE
jgi:hypothetical protein